MCKLTFNITTCLCLALITFYQLIGTSTAASLVGHDCFAMKEDPTALICRSIPDCSRPSTIKLFKIYKTIVFDLENRNSVQSRAFYNCSFDYSLTIHFKNVKRLSSYAFDSIGIGQNQMLTVKLDGAALNLDKKSSQSKLFINKCAFNNIVVRRKAVLSVLIKNYEWVYVKDTLVENGLWQGENSEINVNVNNVEQVWFKSKEDRMAGLGSEPVDTTELEMSDEKPVNLDASFRHYSSNVSYALLINNVNSLVFDSSVYASVQVNSYSDFSVYVKLVKMVFMDANLFDSLILGFYSR